MIRRAVLLGTGSALPSRVVSNSELAETVDTSDEWIVERTGIRQRHIAADGETTSTLATDAARKALAAASVAPEEIGLIILATATPDQTFPASATLVQAALGINDCIAFDVAAVCSGFLYALSVADSMIRGGAADKAIVIGSETFSRILDWDDRGTCVLFGDGAGAVVLSPAAPGEPSIIDFCNLTDGTGGPSLQMPAGGSRMPASHETVDQGLHFVKQDGSAVFKFAVRMTQEISVRILERNNLTGADLDLFVSHQANRRIIEAAAQRLGLPEDKVIINLERYGNTTAGTIPLALEDARRQGKLKKGDLVLLASVGAGFTVGSMLLRWSL